MPALRGIEPTSSAHDVPSNAVLRSAVASMPCEQRVRAVLELHHHALERGHRGLDLEQAQHDGLVGAEQLTARDAVRRARSRSGRAAPVTVTWTGLVAMKSNATRAAANLVRSDHVEEQLARLGRARRCARRRPRCPRRGRGAPGARGGGTGAARRRARRPCPARSPSTSIAHRRSDGTPGPRRPSDAADRRRGAGRGRAHAREPLEAPRHVEPLGQHARGAPPRRRSHRNATVRPDGGSDAAAITAPITCGAGGPCRSSSRTRPHRARARRRR